MTAVNVCEFPLQCCFHPLAAVRSVWCLFSVASIQISSDIILPSIQKISPQLSGRRILLGLTLGK